MNREIKFRAWDLELDEMLVWEESDVSKVDGWEIAMILADDTFNVMQFTGLKDKNGKEIYEGDIVRCASKRACPHEVVWMDEIPSTNLGGAPGFYLKGLNEGYAFGGEEIIGNIYENPDLLAIQSKGDGIC